LASESNQGGALSGDMTMIQKGKVKFRPCGIQTSP